MTSEPQHKMSCSSLRSGLPCNCSASEPTKAERERAHTKAVEVVELARVDAPLRALYRDTGALALARCYLWAEQRLVALERVAEAARLAAYWNDWRPSPCRSMNHTTLNDLIKELNAIYVSGLGTANLDAIDAKPAGQCGEGLIYDGKRKCLWCKRLVSPALMADAHSCSSCLKKNSP